MLGRRASWVALVGILMTVAMGGCEKSRGVTYPQPSSIASTAAPEPTGPTEVVYPGPHSAKEAAQQSLEDWAQRWNATYRNTRYETTFYDRSGAVIDESGDAIGATVQILAEFRPGPEDIWMEQADQVRCERNVARKIWSCLPPNFRSSLYPLTRAEAAALKKMPPLAFAGTYEQYGGVYGGNWGLYTMDADGTDIAPLKLDGGVAYSDLKSLAWSPDGMYIAFTVNSRSMEHNYLDIYVSNADGSRPVKLTNSTNESGYNEPAWSPDGKRIAFAAGSLDEGMDIYVMNADGSDPANLTLDQGQDSQGGGSSPAWSPDGSRIAFVSARDGDLDIYVMDADGTHLTNLTHNHGGQSQETDPAWSPDGKHIAFLNDDHQIYVMDADGTNLTQLTDDGSFGGAPVWSPDGSRIAFIGSGGIYVMNADGSHLLRLMTGEEFYDYTDLTWALRP